MLHVEQLSCPQIPLENVMFLRTGLVGEFRFMSAKTLVLTSARLERHGACK
jgi:hypothetical protein